MGKCSSGCSLLGEGSSVPKGTLWYHFYSMSLALVGPWARHVRAVACLMSCRVVGFFPILRHLCADVICLHLGKTELALWGTSSFMLRQNLSILQVSFSKVSTMLSINLKGIQPCLCSFLIPTLESILPLLNPNRFAWNTKIIMY